MRRRYVWILLAALGLALVAAWSGAAHPAASLQTRSLMGGSDWYHALDVIASVNEVTPEVPLVVLVGGSLARECTVSDVDWAAQIRRRGGPEVLTYDLGSRNQTFYEDVAFVRALPRVPTIVYIAVNMGRFTSPYTTKVVPLKPDAARSAKYTQHHYSAARILSVEKKRWLIGDWMTRRYPVFKRRYSYNLGQLERLIRACRSRGLRPVMLDMPRNLPVIRNGFYRPVQTYHHGCKVLAKRYSVPFINFVAAAKFVNHDFYDLAHVVEPGRAKFQRLLSDQTITLLKRYGMVPPPPSESPSPSPSTSPEASPAG